MTLITSISGIRGTIGGKPGENLTPLDIVRFASAYGAWLQEQTVSPQIVLGRDARLSGEMVAELVMQTLMAQGIDIVHLGLATTPTVEIAVTDTNSQGGIIITASHNPGNWNALKLLNASGEFISEQEGQSILAIATQESFTYAPSSKLGSRFEDDTALQKHIEAILKLPLVEKDAIAAAELHVVVDAINSVGGIAVPALLEALGVRQVTLLNEEVTGHFAHNPEPLPEHLSEICQKIPHVQGDIGMVVDPDVDRLALIDERGEPYGEEYTLVSVADYVLSKTPGNTVSNLSSSQALADITEKHGGEYFPSAVGEVNVVKKMKEKKAVIGGEGNGGIIVPNLHYGRDALAGIALFLSHLATSAKKASVLRAGYPSYHITKNKIELGDDVDIDRMLMALEDKYQQQPINTDDGIKIHFNKEWVHLRRSNTEPILRIIAESESQATAEHLAQKLITDLKEIMSNQMV